MPNVRGEAFNELVKRFPPLPPDVLTTGSLLESNKAPFKRGAVFLTRTRLDLICYLTEPLLLKVETK